MIFLIPYINDILLYLGVETCFCTVHFSSFPFSTFLSFFYFLSFPFLNFAYCFLPLYLIGSIINTTPLWGAVASYFINNPTKYFSITEKYLEKTNLLISAHYWDPLSPKIFELQNLHKFNELKAIGDITCDINGSIPTTLKSTSIENPYF